MEQGADGKKDKRIAGQTK